MDNKIKSRLQTIIIFLYFCFICISVILGGAFIISTLLKIKLFFGLFLWLVLNLVTLSLLILLDDTLYL